MQCPRTGKAMKEVEIGGVKIDVSEGCGGVWFDHFEIKKFDEKKEHAGDELIKLMEQYHNDQIDKESRINCPRHPEAVMMRHFFSVKQKVEIDECPECGGIWLDPGELLAIREAYPSEEEKEKAAEAYIGELFNGDNGLKAMSEKSQDDLQKSKRFANMFRFICPTYYIPGKQDWGAF